MATASGQEGHKRHLRELVPIEQCEAVISCVPESCRRCGGLVLKQAIACLSESDFRSAAATEPAGLV